jgi:galactonate dehydratase
MNDPIDGLEITRLRASSKTTFVFLELRTRSGTRGLGEASMSSDDAATAGHARELFDLYVAGAATRGIPAVVDQLQALVPYPSPALATAISALSQALVDVHARSLRVRLVDALGGERRSSIPLYANIDRGLDDRSSEAFGTRALEARQAGFHTVKCAPFDGIWPGELATQQQRYLLDAAFERLAAVRAAIGPNVELLVDCHGRFALDDVPAIVRRLEPFDLRWFEEPVASRKDFHAFAEIPVDPSRSDEFESGDSDVLKAVRTVTPYTLAGGEFYFGAAQFADLLALHALDTIVPDVKHCGGPEELMRIATLAAAYGVAVAPRNPSGPVATLASAHASAALRCFDLLEYQWGEVPWRAELLQPAERLVDGKLLLPPGEGLGASLNPALVDEYRIESDLVEIA